MSYNKNWKYVPFKDRCSVYSQSIKMCQELWVKPTYKSGEEWEWYGAGLSERVKIIRKLATNQILVQTVGQWEYKSIIACYNGDHPIFRKIKNGKYFVYDLNRFGYGTRGTPSLRVRVK